MTRTRGTWYLTWALASVFAGCGDPGDADSASKAKAETTSSGSTTPVGAATSAKPASADQPAIPEIVTDEVIRVEGGHALLGLPPKRDDWEVVHTKIGDVRGVTLFRGTSTRFTGFISIVFLPLGPADQTPEQAHGRFAAMMKDGMANMSSSGPAKPLELAGALANSWTGPANAAVPERAWLAVVSDGPAAAGVMVRGATQVFDAELMPLANGVIANLLVGARVPKLADTNPSVRLSGVWEYKSGTRTDWLTLDPRGYAHTNPPEDPSWLDLDVCFAIRRSIRTYRFEGDEIVLEPFPADPNKPPYRWKFAQTGETLDIADQDHRRVDQAPVTLAPGTWEYYESSNAGGSFSADQLVYELAADGTYTYSGGFRYMHDQASLDVPGETEWSVSGFAGQVPDKGTWRVEGNLLILASGDRQSARSIYPSQHSAKTVYIDGLRFVKMK